MAPIRASLLTFIQVKSPHYICAVHCISQLESRYACYVKQGTTFMVLDDLSVEPFSSSAALRFLGESKLGEQDLEVRLISIGANEVYEILKAAMFTSSALTIGLSPFLNPVKQET